MIYFCWKIKENVYIWVLEWMYEPIDFFKDQYVLIKIHVLNYISYIT